MARSDGHGFSFPQEAVMNKVRSRFFCHILLLLLVTPPRSASAHHSFAAEYDVNKPVTLQGTVRQFDWINPHAWIHLDVKDAHGNAVGWMVELGTPNVLVRRGFTKRSLEPGAEIVVQGYLAKNGENKINGGTLTFTDGTKLFVGGSSPNELPQK
jgi:Family of unknown function (DUF6152)